MAELWLKTYAQIWAYEPNLPYNLAKYQYFWMTLTLFDISIIEFIALYIMLKCLSLRLNRLND